MYIKVVVKVGFFVGNVGCGSLTSERDTPVCQEERTCYMNIFIYCMYDPLTFTATASLLVFHSVNTRVSFLSVLTLCSLFGVRNCTKQCLFY